MWEKQPLSFYNISEILQESQQKKKLYFWHILDFKEQITDHSCGYLHSLFLPGSDKCFFICLGPYIDICLYYFLNFCCYFYLLFLTFLATRHILQFAMFDSMSLQLARNITEIKKTFHSTRRKKKCRVNYNQNKYSNIIKFGTKYKLFFPLY